MDGAPLATAVDRTAAVAHFRALGTTVTLAVTRHESLRQAERVFRDELDAIDRACSRFRPDAEIWKLYGDGRPVAVSEALFEAVSVACAVAARSEGAVDPTVGQAVEALGYDRDFAQVPALGSALAARPVPAPGWWRIGLDDASRSVSVPFGVRLDLGASAKALVTDRAARAIASELHCGALVCVGGDISVSGPTPHGGWPVGIALDSSGPFGAGPVVAVSSGGLASSSTSVRAWRRGGRRLHHIVDPRTGDCASAYWRLVTVAAASCVDANTMSTAAVVWGESAPARLEALGLPARLVRHDGAVVTAARWPVEPSAFAAPTSATIAGP